MIAKGTIVEVFEDPLTMQHKEGNAEILEHVLELDPGVNQYKVNFINDDPEMVVIRTIADTSKKVEFVLSSLKSTSDGKTEEVIAVHFGERGYHPTTYGRQTREWVREMNERLGIDDAIVLAFEACSMFGNWERYEEIVRKMKAKVVHV
jgi:coenzyme F420-reducing hydrogenase delta subunit